MPPPDHSILDYAGGKHEPEPPRGKFGVGLLFLASAAIIIVAAILLAIRLLSG